VLNGCATAWGRNSISLNLHWHLQPSLMWFSVI
jgi:hypothetical protein